LTGFIRRQSKTVGFGFFLFFVVCLWQLGFIPAAIVKLMDERFASGLHANHPMGHYLEALHH
jgi:hypothetical protein